MHTFGLIFLAALLLTVAARLWLSARHATHVLAHRNAVPAQFADVITLEAHQRAADYTGAKTRFAMLSIVVEAAIALIFTFGGGLQALHELTAAWFEPGILRGLALIGGVALVTMVIDIPFSLYRTFVIEERYGFNKVTVKLFWIDFIKGLAVGAALGLPLIAAVLWLMERMGEWWWFYAWLTLMGYMLFVQAIAPTWIMPIFNKFSPLQDDVLQKRVEALLQRCGFKVKGLMVMNGSLRSSHGNAFFTGFGKTKRIVFFDTLLSRLEPQEVEAVLAHELGHFKLKHVIKGIIQSFIITLGFLWLLGWVLDKPWFYEGLGVTTPSTAMALVLFSIVVPVFTFLFQPLSAMISRKHEFEADAFAAQYTPAADLITALVKLYKDNASTLTPDPLHSAVYDSHPPATTRIARLQQAGAR
ncbi:MAG: M48 family metallopeptidase [Burkholderiales bacterium]|jgi:STE24 endopeptidase|nr:M48 family metallopeptidase [Burkholderiales bacterium]